MVLEEIKGTKETNDNEQLEEEGAVDNGVTVTSQSEPQDLDQLEGHGEADSKNALIDESEGNTKPNDSTSLTPPNNAMADNGNDLSSDPAAAGSHPTAEPKIIKKGDQVITAYVDERTGKIAAYEPGMKLEVSDFAGTWYPAKVVEIDNKENEILVHFENWSSRFDEWIKMDSNRLRPAPNTNVVKTTFKVGEQVEALWGMDGQKYPGEILSILPNDYYQVLFEDGIRYKKKYNQIFKLKMATRGSGRLSTDMPATPITPPTVNPKAVVTKPLPKLTPAPFLLSAPPGNGGDTFLQQPVQSLPPNVPLLASLTPTKGRSVVQPAQSHPVFEKDHQRQSQSQIKETPPLIPKPHFSVFAPIPTDLGKRKRTITDYSQLLKTPILQNPKQATAPGANSDPNNTSGNRRRRKPQVKQVIEDKGEGQQTVRTAGTKNHPSVPSKTKLNTKLEESTLAEELKETHQNEINNQTSEKPAKQIEQKNLATSSKTFNPEFTAESQSEVLPSNKTPSVTPEDAPLAKRKRTIHDYSMLLKTRLPRLSFTSPSNSETDPSPKIVRRRRRKNAAISNEIETGLTETPETEKVGSTSKVEQPKSPQPAADIIKDKHALESASEKQAVDRSKPVSEPLEPRSPASPIKSPTLPKRTITKPQTLVEFDMFAPKPNKRNAPFRNSRDKLHSPDKLNDERKTDLEIISHSSPTNKTLITLAEQVKQNSASVRFDTDEELLDIPEFATQTQETEKVSIKKIDKDKPFQEEVESEQHQPIILYKRPPGRPFKKNKPPPGHPLYGVDLVVPAKPQTLHNSSASSPVAAVESQAKKAGPASTTKTVTRHCISRFMRHAFIPLVPVTSEGRTEELLRGLSRAKIEKLQRKLLKNGTEYRIDAEPPFKDACVDVINCQCGSTDEHGFMIQCEFCQCWQHGNCFGFAGVDDMPQYYVCDSCRFPYHARESMKDEWNQEFKRKGRLPRLRLRAPQDPDIERAVLESSQLQDRLFQILDIVHSNRVKLQIANTLPEHPKIYQWDKPQLSVKEDLKIRMYNKIYKPVLRRLIYLNRHDSNYEEKLMKKVENRLNGCRQSIESDGAVSSTELESSSKFALNGNDLFSDAGRSKDSWQSDFNPDSTEAEVSSLLNDLLIQVDFMIEQQKELDQPIKPTRPTELSVRDDNIDPTDKITLDVPEFTSDTDKKDHTPLVEDLSVLDSIPVLSVRDEDFVNSIMNDLDFEKSFSFDVTDPQPSVNSVAMAIPAEVKPINVPTLTRITPELCRNNLLNHITDQQEVVDKCLKMVEDKVLAMEGGRMKGNPPSDLDVFKLSRLQSSVKRVLAVLEMLKGFPTPGPRKTYPVSHTKHPSGIENDPNQVSASNMTDDEED